MKRRTRKAGGKKCSPRSTRTQAQPFNQPEDRSDGKADKALCHAGLQGKGFDPVKRRSPGKLGPRRIVVLSFLWVIGIGTLLLMLPVSVVSGRAADGSGVVFGKGLSFADSLFTASSAVCVTGLTSIDPGLELSAFGKTLLAVLIQMGGLGIASAGVIAALAAGGKLSMGRQQVLREGFNLSSGKGLAQVVKTVLYMTLIFQAAGAALCYPSFSRSFSPAKAAGISLFHSIASFNNAGFDLLGNYKSLQDYRSDWWLCSVTSGLVIFGGLGFFVISELASRQKPRKWSLHTKVVLWTTAVLLAGGTVILKLLEGESFTWKDAAFQSVFARTAGFATLPMEGMTTAGLFFIMALMFIGASPGSTGGGIKTTTCFVLVRKMQSVVSNRHCTAFKRKIPEEAVSKAFLVFFLASGVIFVSTFFICILEPGFTFEQIFFEIVSAFATTGLSTGITPLLSDASKIVISVTMLVGRLGPLTMATIWLSRELPAAVYSQENITIG